MESGGEEGHIFIHTLLFRRKRRSLEKLEAESGGEEGRRVSNRKRLAKLMERAVLKVRFFFSFLFLFLSFQLNILNSHVVFIVLLDGSSRRSRRK